jgi:hypothetical protein
MNDLTICFVLDKSGSMQSIADDAIGGFNAFRRAQAAERGRTALSLTLFDGTVHAPHPPIPIDEVANLTASTYVPCGQTALYDAVGAAIEAAQASQASGATLVAILTDGAENASRRYTRESLAALVAAKKQSGWDFMYLGAVPENWADAVALGMAHAPFAPTPAGMATAYTTVAARATNLRGT